MRSVVSPTPYGECERSLLYLAGDVSGANWQAQFESSLADLKGTLFNPRAPNSATRNGIARTETMWEFAALRQSDLIAFWFSEGEINPITLFELGAQMQRLALLCGPAGGSARLPPKIFIGAARGYLKAVDVRIQTELLMPLTPIVETLPELIALTGDFVTTFTAQDYTAH